MGRFAPGPGVKIRRMVPRAAERSGWTAAINRLAASTRFIFRSCQSDARHRPEAVGQVWPKTDGQVLDLIAGKRTHFP